MPKKMSQPINTDERAPLLASSAPVYNNVPRSPAVPRHASTLHNTNPLGDWHEFLFNSQTTPGTASDNALVKISSNVWHVFKVTMLSNYVNFLLIAVPFGIIAGESGWSPTLVFTINFFAIIPLAAVLSFATEKRSGQMR